jgi:hypothetical protein
MAEAVSCKPVTIKAWFQSKGKPCEFIVDEMALRLVLGVLGVVGFPVVSIIPPVLHTHISFICY